MSAALRVAFILLEIGWLLLGCVLFTRERFDAACAALLIAIYFQLKLMESRK